MSDEELIKTLRLLGKFDLDHVADRIEQLLKKNEELERELEAVYEGMGGV